MCEVFLLLCTCSVAHFSSLKKEPPPLVRWQNTSAWLVEGQKQKENLTNSSNAHNYQLPDQGCSLLIFIAAVVFRKEFAQLVQLYKSVSVDIKNFHFHTAHKIIADNEHKKIYQVHL